MKSLSVLGAVLAAFREYLQAATPFTRIEMNLAIFAVHLLFDTHPPVPHIKAVFDAAALEPLLSANLDS